jgi:hypothetical protein
MVVTSPVLPTITGPSLLCRGSDTFTVTDAPAGFTWATSSNLTITGSNNNTSVTVGASDPDYTQGSSGWVSVKNSGGVEMARKDVWIGYPEVEIEGYDYASSQGSYSAVYNPLANPNFYWFIDVPWPNGYSISSHGSWADVYFYNNAIYSLSLAACNSCGCGNEAHKDIYASSNSLSLNTVATYPNPTSGILNIEIDASAIARTKALEQTTTVKTDPTYDFRLYDYQGNLLRNAKTKGGTVQFNVAGLPNGIYYLHVYDGTGNKPEMRQIVVEH